MRQQALYQGTTLCGVDVGDKLLEGLVTNVHDGDTVTLRSAAIAYQIRLDSIDAPALAQSFGSLSQGALGTKRPRNALVLPQRV